MEDSGSPQQKTSSPGSVSQGGVAALQDQLRIKLEERKRSVEASMEESVSGDSRSAGPVSYAKGEAFVTFFVKANWLYDVHM